MTVEDRTLYTVRYENAKRMAGVRKDDVTRLFERRGEDLEEGRGEGSKKLFEKRLKELTEYAFKTGYARAMTEEPALDRLGKLKSLDHYERESEAQWHVTASAMDSLTKSMGSYEIKSDVKEDLAGKYAWDIHIASYSDGYAHALIDVLRGVYDAISEEAGA